MTRHRDVRAATPAPSSRIALPQRKASPSGLMFYCGYIHHPTKVPGAAASGKLPVSLSASPTLNRSITMCTAIVRDRRPARIAAKFLAVSVAALAATLLASGTASAQSTGAATPAAQAGARATAGPDLQGLWDFTMRVGDRTSPGFFGLGPVEGGWAGSITMYLTNTLAIRSLTVNGDSVRMIVASREGDVRFLARLTDEGRTMEGIVEYHGGARLPMTATRRAQPVLPR